MWYILGDGPFSLEVYDWSCDALGDAAAREFGGFLSGEADPAPHSSGLPVLSDRGFDFAAADFIVNAIAKPAVKASLLPQLTAEGARFKTIIHPTATVRASEIGDGTVICPGVVVGAQTKIGVGCTINYQVGIGHETTMADFVTISPGVQIGGRSTIGARSFVGLSAAIIDNIKIGKDVQINAGAVVISRIKDEKTVSGNPARRTQTF
ncbi:acetyltransferase [Litorimonas sp. RW-G-Af-16]|uniref:acetyltransferase n=1 Tax=Litorimonas sp. RW-G-Af-16 TaxID=3241168 RepID=UPI00390C5E65